MFDTRAIGRRLGRAALRPSVLAQELQHRLSLFKRVRNAFAVADCTTETPLSDNLIIDLTYLYLIMTENDGKNEVQLRELARSCHISVNEAWTEQPIYSIPRLQLTTLFLSIISLLEIDDVSSETSEHRSAILDIMEPWAIEAFDEPHTAQPYYFYSVLGSTCRLKPISLVYLARQCTSARYITINTRGKFRQGQPIKTYSSPSMRFDDDWTNHVHISSSPPHHVPGLDSVRLFQKSTGTWNGSWEGALIVPSIIDPLRPCQIFTCACPLQMNIREYVSFDESQFVSYVMKGDDMSTDYSNEMLVEMAWLPKGVEFEEFRVSKTERSANGFRALLILQKNVLRIYDPIKMRWVTYHSVMDYKNEKNMKRMSIVDTILIGETDSTHQGTFSFHGRINPYFSRLALIRTPSDPQSQGLGTWVLYGEARRGVGFWGNWRASLTKPVPAAHGWFYIKKNNQTQL